MTSERIPFAHAVHAQPEHLRTAIQHISSSLGSAKLAPWQHGETIAILAMGASTNSAHALTTALTSHGVRSINITPSDLFDAPADFEPGDHYIIVTESGRSPEPIAAASLRGIGNRITISNFPGAQVAAVTDHAIDYGGIPDSPVYTSGYLSTLVAYAALLDTQGLPSGLDLTAVPEFVRAELERFASTAVELAPLFDSTNSADIIGRGYGFCSASQAALIFREALRIAATAWDTYQFLHGPIESVNAETTVLVIGNERELDMVPQLTAAGAQVIVFSAAPEQHLTRLANEGARVVSFAHTQPGFERTISETVLLHLLTIEIAARQNTVIEEFRYAQPDTKLPNPSGEPD